MEYTTAAHTSNEYWQSTVRGTSHQVFLYNFEEQKNNHYQELCLVPTGLSLLQKQWIEKLDHWEFVLYLLRSLKIFYFWVITDKIPLFTFRLKAKRSFSRIKSYFWPISHAFYGLLKQITSSDEPYNTLAMPRGSNEVNIVVF